MATYDIARTEMFGNLEASVGRYLADRILAALDSDGRAPQTLSIVSDFVPGDVIPARADVVIVRAGESGAVSVPSGVGAIIFTGSAGIQLSLNMEGSLAVRLTEGADVVRATALPHGDAAQTVSVDLGAGDDIFIGAQTIQNHVIGGAGDDWMMGGGKNDWFEVGQGNDVVDGGDGYDQAFIRGSIKDYASAINADGSLSLTHTASGEVTRLANLEFIGFEDGSTMLAVSTETGFVAAALHAVILGQGVAIDPTAHEVQSGMSASQLIDVAADVLVSEAFTLKYGAVSALSDAEFLAVMYASAFERDPDSEGLQYWLEHLASGTSRGEIAYRFATSSEAHQEFTTIHLIDKDHGG